jgi:hypothetical protein
MRWDRDVAEPSRLGGLEVYWHVYRCNEIKPELRGNLRYLLEIPLTLGVPVLRHLVEPCGLGFLVSPRQGLTYFLHGQHHGILYDGVGQAAVQQVIQSGPGLEQADRRFAFYNRQLVCHSRNFFLLDPERGFDTLPEPTIRLLCGQNAIFGKICTRRGGVAQAWS